MDDEASRDVSFDEIVPLLSERGTLEWELALLRAVVKRVDAENKELRALTEDLSMQLRQAKLSTGPPTIPSSVFDQDTPPPPDPDGAWPPIIPTSDLVDEGA